jgi:hypothetical protein
MGRGSGVKYVFGLLADQAETTMPDDLGLIHLHGAGASLFQARHLPAEASEYLALQFLLEPRDLGVRHRLEVQGLTPSGGELGPLLEEAPEIPPVRANQLPARWAYVARLSFTLGEWGMYWVRILLDREEVGRIPLELFQTME